MDCSVDESNNYRQFKFPKNQYICKKWLVAIRKLNLKPNLSNAGLCKNHFFSKYILSEGEPFLFKI